MLCQDQHGEKDSSAKWNKWPMSTTGSITVVDVVHVPTDEEKMHEKCRQRTHVAMPAYGTFRLGERSVRGVTHMRHVKLQWLR